jgi:hypothetical protein
MKTNVENNIEYIVRDGIWYPNLRLREEGIQLGKYGKMRLEYLKHHKNILYHSLLINGELYGSCKRSETQAQDMFYLEYNRI